eukprot:CAMPEP_0118953844 /NCGR_PEP_ID=MMETSP1169-20130426/57263_1 /TAXON_ID=36882 /ORGANISM="Pyramimonas obovata, Strain CCMP722" /LENGTH=56 /DNA_ID=CAMNT_0006901389 /DNA_START=9 /DNA_END=176 /DNA_ORIENTATION=+
MKTVLATVRFRPVPPAPVETSSTRGPVGELNAAISFLRRSADKVPSRRAQRMASSC